MFTYLILGPEEVLEILDPFEVADNNSSALAEYVWNDNDPTFLEDLIRIRGCRAVCPLDNDAARNVARVRCRNLPFDRSRDQDVSRKLMALFRPH